MPLKRGGKLSDMEGKSQHLFPRISDEVTLNKIVPKLSWRDLWVLSSVSRVWCHAIRSRQVYAARVHQHASETLVILTFHTYSILYSVRDNSFHHLPPIPGIDGGFPQKSQSVSLDGKLYVLGGELGCGSAVYVFDPVGRRQWKQCSSMIDRRVQFACGVMDGKIYVFGGYMNGEDCFSESEVYDPKKDTWRPIMPMVIGRCEHRVTIVVKELWVYDGKFQLSPNVLEYKSGDEHVRDIGDQNFLEVYDPILDEWRLILQSWMGTDPLLFIAQGKLYRTTRVREQVHIWVHDKYNKRWDHLRRCTFVSVGPPGSIWVKLFAVVAVNDELLANVSWCKSRNEDNAQIDGFSLVRSEGFCSGASQITWENVHEATPFLEDLKPGWTEPTDFCIHSVEV